METAAKLNSPVIIQFSNGGAIFNAGKGLKNENQVAAINANERPWPASNNDCRLDDADTTNNTHSHSVSGTTDPGGLNTNSSTVTISGTTGNQSDSGTNSQGSSATNKNLPPYYALCYIMKT